MTCSVPQRGLEIQWQLATPNAPLLFTVENISAGERKITVTTIPYGLVDMWLYDDGAERHVRSTNLPSITGQAEWRVACDSTGVGTVTVKHSGAFTWHVTGVLLGQIPEGEEVGFS